MNYDQDKFQFEKKPQFSVLYFILFTGHQGYIHAVQYSTFSHLTATCGEDGTVRTWDVRGKFDVFPF